MPDMSSASSGSCRDRVTACTHGTSESNTPGSSILPAESVLIEALRRRLTGSSILPAEPVLIEASRGRLTGEHDSEQWISWVRPLLEL
jgi:hypothetical protein